MLKFICLILVVLGTINGFGQSTSISGRIADTSDNRPLASAVVSLLSRDSVLLGFTRTNAAGEFRLFSGKPGDFLLMVSFPKYVVYLDELTLPANGDRHRETIHLIKQAALLQEVIVSQKIGAIRVKGDTLEFKADSFAVRQGANVEELLKKLPGLQVNNKGEITAHGQKVQKLLVDGDEFFSDDPAVVTRNLSADAIDKVQVFDKKSDQAAFTGIDDGEKQKTLNLQLKEDRKKGYFGKAKIAGGLPGFFENEAMINRFKGKRKMAAYGTMANTGKAGLGWRDNDQFGSGNNMTFDEENGFFFSTGEDDELNTWGGSYNGEGLPKAWTAGAHYSNKWQADQKHLNLGYQYFKQDITNEGNTFSQYILPDTLYFSNQKRNTHSLKARHQANGFYELKPDSSSSIKFSFKGSRLEARNESNFLTNSLNEENEPVNDQHRWLQSQGIKQQSTITALWRKKMAKKGRSISLNFDHTYSDNQTDGLLKALNQFYNSIGENFKTDSIDQKKNSYFQGNTFHSKIVYTEPLSKYWFLELNNALEVNNSKSLRNSFSKTLDGKYEERDSLLSNHYAFDYSVVTGGLNFRFNGSKLNFSFGSTISKARFKQTELLKDKAYRYDYTNVFPKANIRFKLGPQRALNFGYSGSTKQPTLQQIQPVAENTDPLNIQVGNPGLKQEFRHNFNGFFNDYKVMTSRNVYLNFSVNILKNAISQRDIIDSVGKRIYQFVNVDNNLDYFVNTGYWYQFKKLHLNVNAGLNINGGRNYNYINLLYNTNTYNQFGGYISCWYEKENKLSLHLQGRPSYSVSRSSIRKDIVTRYWTLDNEFSANFQLPKKFELNSSLNYNWRQKTDAFGTDRNVWLWRAEIAKKLLANDALEIRLSINDILNQNLGFRRNASSNFISENTYTTLQRYWLIGLIWNFNKKPGEK